MCIFANLSSFQVCYRGNEEFSIYILLDKVLKNLQYVQIFKFCFASCVVVPILFIALNKMSQDLFLFCLLH